MRPLDLVLERVPDARHRGHYYLARCPGHEDRRPSLSVTEGADGKVLLKCFAGCPTARVVSRLGLTMRDLFPRRAL
jgi:hypothetical protein